MEASHISLSLPRDARAPREARAAVREAFARTLSAERISELALIVSELVSNAFVHGEGRIELRLELAESIVKGEVIDDGEGFEHELRADGISAVGGYGLTIVSRLAANWGVHEGTTHVWFELPVAGLAPTHPEPPELGHPGEDRLPEA